MTLIIGERYQVKWNNTISVYVLDGLIGDNAVLWTGKCHKTLPVSAIVGGI